MSDDLEGTYLYGNSTVKTIDQGMTSDGGRWSYSVIYKPMAIRWLPNWHRDDRGVWVQVKQSMTPEQRMELVKESK